MERQDKKEQTECKSEYSRNDKLLIATSIINFITLVIVLIRLIT